MSRLTLAARLARPCFPRATYYPSASSRVVCLACKRVLTREAAVEIPETPSGSFRSFRCPEHIHTPMGGEVTPCQRP